MPHTTAEPRDGWSSWCERHPLPMWTHRVGEGTILRTNAAMRSLRPGLEGQHISALVTPLAAPTVEPLLVVRPELPPLSSGWRLELGESSTDATLLLAPVRDGDEEVFQVTVLQVLEQGLVVHALHESETRFRNLAANVPGALFQYLLRPDGTNHIIFMSEGCFELWEVTAEDIVENANHLWDLILREDVERVRASVLASADTLEPWLSEFRVLTRSGRLKWFQGSGRPRRLPDGSTLWDSFIIDLTAAREAQEARSRLEFELQQSRRIEAIGRLAGGVAHDFNNLLTVILGNALEGASRHPEARAFFDDIVDAARRSADLTSQLLAFARKQPASPRVVRLAKHVSASLRLIKRLVGEGIEVVTSLASNADVLIDPIQLDQILTNLAANARDAMELKGRLHIEVGDEGQLALLRVRDTGQGIDEETRQRLFDPFFTTRRERGGTGLGLATVYGIVAQNGGTIQVESRPGHGTSFEIRLPTTTPAEAPKVPPPSLAFRGHGEVVVLVEDEPSLGVMLERQLRQLGYEVKRFDDPKVARRWLEGGCERGQRIDLLLTDMVMPGLDGIELAAAARSCHPGLPILVVSAHSDAPFDPAKLERSAFLPKPFDAVTLARQIRALLDCDQPG